ncbi:hypothetical protein Tco_1184759 [Tanacetum coccineum]
MKKKTCKNNNKNIQKEFIEIEVLKASAQHSSAYETTILNIFEEDVEPQPNSPLQEIIILDPDNQPMWESAKTVASTPNSAITRPDVDNNFVINNTHLKIIWENKFDGYLQTDLHDHIREFLAICDMFKYGETQSEVVKLLIFPFSLTEPPPPPQAQTEHVNAVFTESGKFDDPSKDPPPPIIDINKKKEQPIKTTKGDYHLIKTKEYPFTCVDIVWKLLVHQRAGGYLGVSMLGLREVTTGGPLYDIRRLVAHLLGNHLEDVEVRKSGYLLIYSIVRNPLECVVIPLSRGSFDVIVGTDWLSKRKFMIVCHEKVVRIPLKGEEILRVHGERTQGVVRTLMNTQLVATASISSNLEPSENDKEIVSLKQLQELGRQGVHIDLVIFSGVSTMLFVKKKDGSFRMHDLKWRIVQDKRTYSQKGYVGLDQQMERKGDESLYFMDQIWVLLVGSVMDEAHASRLRWMIYLVVLADAAESVRDTIGFEYCLASSSGWTKSPVLWAEIGESSLTGPELVLDMTDKVVLIKEKLKAARDRQKSYADNRRKPLEFEVGDRVMLKVSPWKGVIRFGKKGKLAPRYVGPFEILERVGPVAYRLRLPEELSGIKVDKTLRFVEEPVENSDREVKRLKCSRMVVVKVHLGSKRDSASVCEAGETSGELS